MSRKFLVIDDHADGLRLLTRSLLRKFPHAITLECVDAGSAIAAAAAENIDAIVVHRAGEVPGVELLPELRRVNPHVPILAVSGIDRTDVAIAAGATRFLNYDQWLMVGTTVAEMLERK